MDRKGKSNCRGFIFCSDAALSLLLIFVGCAVIFSRLGSSLGEQESMLREFSGERRAIALAGALVSDRNSENPLFGSAFRSEEKKRVLQNVVDYSLLARANAGQAIGDGFFAKEIHLLFPEGGVEVVSAAPAKSSGNCYSVERFVIIRYPAFDRKAILGVIVCEA